MITNAVHSFLLQLKENNNKPWFDSNKNLYEEAKKDFEQFVGLLLVEMANFEPEIAHLKAKECIFRIFRDVRFAKDKSPYKPNFGAFFSKGGKKFPGAGFYLHIEPNGKSFVGGGLWMPEANLLKAVRQEIDYNFKEWEDFTSEKNFKKTFGTVQGEKLKTNPKGYDAENPAIEVLKLKSFTVTKPIDDEILLNKKMIATCMQTFQTMKPLVDFLNRAIE